MASGYYIKFNNHTVVEDVSSVHGGLVSSLGENGSRYCLFQNSHDSHISEHLATVDLNSVSLCA